MNDKRLATAARLAGLPALLLASTAMAGQPAGITVSAVVGTPVGNALGAVLAPILGSALPVGLGGAAAITGLGLIIGVQLIKRRGKK